MSQPMQFPRSSRFLLRAVLLIFAGPFAVGLPAALWLTWPLDPVQSFYFGPYLLAAIEGSTKGATVAVRYAVRTAPGRAPASLVPGDAERGTAASQPLILSPNALAEGWRGVSVSPSRKVRSLELESYLRTTIYGGDSAWWLLGEPVIVLLAVVLVAYLIVRVLRSGSRSDREHEQSHGRRTKGPGAGSWSGPVLALRGGWYPTPDGEARAPGLNRAVGLVGLALTSSFGAGSGMFGLPPMAHGRSFRTSLPAQPVQWSTVWGAIAGVVVLFFLFSIGPGRR